MFVKKSIFLDLGEQPCYLMIMETVLMHVRAVWRKHLAKKNCLSGIMYW